MKKLTRRGFTAAGILSALAAGITALPGCNLTSCNEPETVYGPPSWFDPSANEVEDVYGPPDVDPSEWDNPDAWDKYDPNDNELVDVYGPPADEDDGEDKDKVRDEDKNEDKDKDKDEDNPYDASDNIAQTMYGPMEPYDFDKAD